MAATIRTAISAVYQVIFCHYAVTFLHVKIPPFLQVIRKTVAVAKNMVEITHKQSFCKLTKLLFIRDFIQGRMEKSITKKQNIIKLQSSNSNSGSPGKKVWDFGIIWDLKFVPCYFKNLVYGN
jgi:hypothetical protein